MFFFSDIAFINTETIYYLRSYFIIFVIGVIASTPVVKYLINKVKFKNKEEILGWGKIVYILFILVLATAYLIDASFNPFLYFRF